MALYNQHSFSADKLKRKLSAITNNEMHKYITKGYKGGNNVAFYEWEKNGKSKQKAKSKPALFPQ